MLVICVGYLFLCIKEFRIDRCGRSKRSVFGPYKKEIPHPQWDIDVRLCMYVVKSLHPHTAFHWCTLL